MFVWDNCFDSFVDCVLSILRLDLDSDSDLFMPDNIYPFFELCKIQQCPQYVIGRGSFDPRPQIREEFWLLSIRSLKSSVFDMFLLVPTAEIPSSFV